MNKHMNSRLPAPSGSGARVRRLCLLIALLFARIFFRAAHVDDPAAQSPDARTAQADAGEPSGCSMASHELPPLPAHQVAE